MCCYLAEFLLAFYVNGGFEFGSKESAVYSESSGQVRQGVTF